MTSAPPHGDPHGSPAARSPHWHHVEPLDVSTPDGDAERAPGRAGGGATALDTVTPEDDLLRRLLGGAALRLGTTPRDRLWGWVGPLLVTALAAVLRLVHLDRPPTLVFDETYYVKQAYTLLRVGYEAQWPENPNPAFESGAVDTFLPQADYAVHPQVGKWMIALGMQLAGADSPVGWRLASALVGTLSVLLLARLARRLFASTLLGTVAGALLALDGQAVVHSRTALLDGFLTFFVLAAFGALLLDREQARRRLARRLAQRLARDAPGTGSGPPGLGGLGGLGPGLGVRWWRLAAGVLLGLAIGTKWSGLYFLAVFGVLTVAWDVAARRSAGVPRWVLGGVVRDGLPAFAALVPVAGLTYVASWASWFRTPEAYLRQWAATTPGEGVAWLPESLRSWWHYHREMWGFHQGLTSEHSYAAHPLGWPLQWRPTSFFYETPEPATLACGADRCAAEVLALGNPVLWWMACVAALAAVWWLVRYRDWRAAAVLSGVVAGWLPWLALAHRTIFTFYSIAFTPWVVLTVTWALSRVLDLPDDDARPSPEPLRLRNPGVAVTATVVVLVAAATVFFYPLWTAQPVPFWYWRLHMWLPSWI